MAAARRARAAAAAEPPSPPEPVPEPEPETKEPEPAKTSLTDEQQLKSESRISTGGDGVRERIIERIIICPGGQNPYMQQPPQMPMQQPCPCPCPQPVENRKRKGKKGKRKGRGDEDEDGLCKHPFCIVQRAKAKPQGLPWASGLYPGPPAGQQMQGPPVVICQRPVICQCRTCKDVCEDSSEEECEDEDSDPPKQDTEQFMTFMNMVFAAANVMNERSNVF